MGRKAVFMDRDDTLIEDPGYINHPNQVKLLPGAAAALIQLKRMGYLLVIASNQSAVARGIVTEEMLEQIHHRLRKLLADEGASIDAIYYCPYHPDGVIPKYRMESDLRKPNPGMLLRAAEDLDIDFSRSWMIGDSYRDITAGVKVGCRTILIDSPVKRPTRNPSDPTADRKVGSLREAANVIRMLDQQQQKLQTEETQPQDQTVASSFKPAAPQETPPSEEEAISQPDPQPAEDPAPAPPPQPQASPAFVPPASPREPEIPCRDPAPFTAESAPEPQSHTVLQEILHLVRSRQRQELYEEFSFFRLVAMITEIISLFCLILSVWFWFDATRPISSAQMMLGYALVLQLVTIALLLVQKDR